MANDSDSAAAKVAALKKAIDESQAAVAAVALAWPITGYDSLIPYILVHVVTVYALFIDVSVLDDICAHMLSFRYEMHAVNAMFTVYLWIRLTENVLIYLAIQKPYYRKFSAQSFAATLKPEKFTGSHFKRW